MDLLISVNPQHSQKILSGQKRFEFRHTMPSKKAARLYIYETRPTKMVVGYVLVKRVIQGEVKPIREKTKHGSCLTDEEYFDYYQKNKKAVAFEIYGAVKFDVPKPFTEYTDNKRPPYNYYYI